MVAMTAPLVASAEPVSWRTKIGKAMRSVQSPAIEIRPAHQSRAKLRWRRGANCMRIPFPE